MSQNKTVIQGLEPETQVGGVHGGGGASNNFYSRGNRGAARGTVVPGMMDAPSQPERAAEPQQPSPKAIKPGKPVVGFLYSISRTPAGEYWPLHIGRNSIGQSADSDIVLAEGTVSSNHAVIVTRQVKSGVIAAIKDADSTNGTKINGETIGFDSEECHDGDVITIGNNYELVLILVDAAKMGLSVSKDFLPVAVEEENDEEDDVPIFGMNDRPTNFSPYNDGPTTWGGGSSYGNTSGGTVGLDGSMAGGNRGGTVPL